MKTINKATKWTLTSLLLLSIIVSSVGILPEKAEAYTTSIFPQSNPVSSSVSTFNMDGASKGVRLALTSLQGLVNRTTPRIYLYHSFVEPTDGRNDTWMMDYYKSKSWVTSDKVYTDPYALIKDFKSSAAGLIVMDPTQDFTINIATNIAGVENLIMVYPDQISLIDLPVVKDLRGMFTNSYDAYVWVYNNYWASQTHDVLANVYYGRADDFQRDYLVQFKVPTFWLPGPSDPDYSLNLTNLIKYIMHHAPENIPILGFWAATTDAGLPRGVGEYPGVKLAGQFGKFTVVSNYAGNYSFHSGIQPSSNVFQQQAQRQKAFHTYDPTKKYVTLTLMESGDSPGYMQFGFDYLQWKDPIRGQVPVSYGITPTMRSLMPGLLQRIYESATPNDYFFSSISGDGYMYPLDGYGDNGVLNSSHVQTKTKAQILTDYYQKSGNTMNALDMDMLGLYSHAGTAWNYSEDDNIVNTYITPNINNMSSILSDMGRNAGTTPANANRLLYDNTTIHHNLTQWSKAVDYYSPNDTSKDTAAANWLVSEIQANSIGGNFINAMTYSWHYGPRRLKMVKDILEAQGYVFVTANEFEYLWRYSQNLNLPSRDPNNYYSTNQVAGANATASSQFDVNYLPANAIDANTATEWATTNADKNTGWIRLTWGSAKSINKIALKDRANSTDQITGGVLSFSDGTSFDVGTLMDAGKDNVYEFPTKNVTWVQFTITSTSGSTIASGLSEFKAYNTPIASYYKDLADGKSVTSSGIWGAGYEAAKAVDGSVTTRWASNTTGATWLKTDLGALYPVKRVKIKWETAGAYTIEVSADGIIYTTVKTGTASSNTTTDDTFTSTSGKYVRVSASAYRSIYSINVFGN